MADFVIDDGYLVLPDRRVSIPPALLVPKAFSKNGVVDKRSNPGRALAGWCAEQMASQAPQKHQDSQFAPEGVDHPSEAPAGHTGPSEPVPAFGLPGGHTESRAKETPAPAAQPIPEQTPAAQPAPSSVPPLGSHESARWLVETVIAAYPGAEPRDWGKAVAMFRNALGYGKLFGDKTRK